MLFGKKLKDNEKPLLRLIEKISSESKFKSRNIEGRNLTSPYIYKKEIILACYQLRNI